MRTLGLVMINVCAKFEVPDFTRYDATYLNDVFLCLFFDELQLLLGGLVALGEFPP